MIFIFDPVIKDVLYYKPKNHYFILFLMKKRLLIFLFFLIIGFTHFYIPRFIIEVDNPILMLAKEIVNSKKPEIIQEDNEDVFFVNSEGFKMNGSFKKSNIKVKGTIILIHGMRGDKHYFKPIIEKLNNKGYNTYAIDLRGHGFSEGTFCTFGAKEKYDIKESIDFLKEKFHISSHIGVWGQSLGGSIALQAMSIDSRIKFGIIESTFSSYTKVTQEYFDRLLHINISPFVNYLSKRAAVIGGFEIEESNTSLACKQVNQPILMSHGTKDIHIPLWHGHANFKALASPKKVFYPVLNADHTNLWKTGGIEYFNRIFDFLEALE